MTTKKGRIVLVTLFAVLCLSTLVLAVNCPIPDTGQTKCYDADGNEISCPSPGKPFYGQDAQHPCNPHSYTSLAGGIMVQDNVTGLVWETKTDDGSIRDKDNTYNWDDAQSVFIAALNSQNFGGYLDWRLPNVNELHSIVDYSTYDPSIKTTFSPNTVSSYYWSSTTNASDPYGAWDVYFGSGAMYFGPKSYLYYVRAVRSGQCGSLDTSTTTTISGLTTTTVPPCTTETLYGEYSRQTELLRHLRDNVLTQTSRGQELIRLYYEWSPVIVKAMEEDENFREYVKEMIDGVVELIEIGVE